MLRQLTEKPPPPLAPFRPLELLRRPLRLPSPDLVHRALTRPWQFRPLAAGMTLLAPGQHDIVEQLAALREIEQPGWPADPLWICVVRRRDGRRVVFGRPPTPEVPLHLAVAASCSVPGYFTPVRIGGRSYIDGGVHSPTNAAILRGAGLDVVLVVSPMSGATGWRPDFYAAARRHATRLLAREVKALQAEGIATVVFAPDEAEQHAMGNDMMSRDRLNQVIQQSFITAGAYAARPEVAAVIRRAADR